MKKMTVEGKILSVGRSDFDPRCKVVVGVPVENEHEEDEEDEEIEYRIFEFEMPEDSARQFGAHLFDRVRVSFTLIPTPQVIDGEKEEASKPACPKGPFHRSGDTSRVQNDDEAS